MPKSIQLRNVPDDLHRELEARAALAGRKPVRPGVELTEAVREVRGD